MSQTSHRPPSDHLRTQDFHQANGWVGDSVLSFNGWRIERLTLPPDAISVPALSEHVLVIACGNSERQVNRFAGQEYDGVGYKNYFFIVPAGTPAEFIWESEDSGIVLSLDPQVLQRTAIQIGYSSTVSIDLRPLVFAQDEQVTYLCNTLMQEIRTKKVGAHLCIKALLMTLSIHLLRHYCAFAGQSRNRSESQLEESQLEESQSSKTESERAEQKQSDKLSSYKLYQVLEYIDGHLATADDTSLNELSTIAGLSSYYFARQFKESMGITPHQYVIQQRIEKAKQLLENKDIPIAKIAIDCGFSNQSHFGRVFRQATGTTPKAYQQAF